MRNWKQGAVLSGQVSSLTDVNACPKFYIDRTSVSDIQRQSCWRLINAKLFADDTSLFYVVHNVDTLAGEVNNNLVKIKT